MWIERLVLTDFRNHADLSLRLDRRPVVLTGPNGAGKTNILEAVSLLAPGQGLRRSPYVEFARLNGSGSWAVAATVQSSTGAVDIGTGLTADGSDRARRAVRVDGRDQAGSGALAQHIEVVWLTPSMDGLFTGPGGDRRRFLDRLIACFDPMYRSRVSRFERAMRQRNRLLEEGVYEHSRFAGLELMMAETGVAIAAARAEAVAALRGAIMARRDRNATSPFPWAEVSVRGSLEEELARCPAVEVEDRYLASLQSGRDRDRAAGRALEGPHCSDLVVAHGPKSAPAHLCSTGEQKALLVGLVLAHAELVGQHRETAVPILLLDEIAAHLDASRRAALFEEIVRLGTQAWMTGTDQSAFADLVNDAQFIPVGSAKSGPAEVLPATSGQSS